MEVNLSERLCKKFCFYYKPSKNDSIACRGFLVIEKLMREGKKIVFKKSKKKLDGIIEKELKKHLCPVCSFFKSDCDFAARKEGVLPCGGFIILGHALETNSISIDDIK